jgi:hypothetical protein
VIARAVVPLSVWVRAGELHLRQWQRVEMVFDRTGVVEMQVA